MESRFFDGFQGRIRKWELLAASCSSSAVLRTIRSWLSWERFSTGGDTEAHAGQGGLPHQAMMRIWAPGSCGRRVMPCVDKVVPPFGFEAFRCGTENEVGPVPVLTRVLYSWQENLGVPNPPGEGCRAAAHVRGGAVGLEPVKGCGRSGRKPPPPCPSGSSDWPGAWISLTIRKP